jgi:hypothetical protein
MPILLHSVLFAACAAAGDGAMTTSVSAAATRGNLHTGVRDIGRISTMIGLFERLLTVPSSVTAGQIAGPMISGPVRFRLALCASSLIAPGRD